MKFQIYARRGLTGRKLWRWRLLAGDNRVLATSGKGYRRIGDMLATLDLVRGERKIPVYEQ